MKQLQRVCGSVIIVTQQTIKEISMLSVIIMLLISIATAYGIYICVDYVTTKVIEKKINDILFSERL